MTRILRAPEVVARVGLSRVSIWRRERCGDFPARRQLGPNCVGWVESEIAAWIESRPVAAADTDAAESVRVRG